MSASSNPNAKLFSVLAYLGILWLVGLLAAGDDAYVKYHVNQGLVLFLVGVAVSIVSAIPVLGLIVGIVGGIFTFVCMILGIINAVQDQAKPLPLIGQIHLLK